MKEETYSLTFKGLLSMTIEDPNEVKNTLDRLECSNCNNMVMFETI